MKYSELNTKGKKEFWKKNPISGDIEIRLPGVSSFKMHCRNDDTVVKELYWTGFVGWEPFSLKVWNALNSLSGNRTKIVLDIGSYSGIYSILAAIKNNTNRVIAFDIQRKCIERIETNFQINNILNAEVIHAAVSNIAEEIDFYFYEEEEVMSSVASIHPKPINTEIARTNSIVLDSFLKINANEELGLLKIDVEGAEKEVIRGAHGLIKQYNPDILIEVNNAEDIDEVFSLLPKDYNYFNLDEDEMKLKGKGFFRRKFRHRNYLFSTKRRGLLEKIILGEL